MKAKWDNLQPRERTTISIAAIALLLLLLYQLILAPIHRGLSNIKTSVVQNQQLLNWMHITEKKIQVLQQSGINSRKVTTATLLSTIDESVHKSPIANNVTLLQQGSNNTVEAKFNRVSFDELTQWMLTLRREYGIDMKQVTISSVSNEGHVQASIIFAVK